MGLFKFKRMRKKEYDETYSPDVYDESEDYEEEETVVLQDKLKKMRKDRNSTERFLKTRMWFSTAVSAFYPDRVKIPPNIGNGVFIGNNQIMTKNSITAYTSLLELSDKTPIAFTSEVVKILKSKVPGIYVDFIVKTIPYKPDLGASGMESRKSQWVKTLDNKFASANSKKRAAKLLHTVEVAKSDETLYKAHMFFQIRAQNGLQIKEAQRFLTNYLNSIDVAHKHIKSRIVDQFKYLTLINNEVNEKVRDIPYIIMSATNLAEILPAIQGLNDNEGNFLGLNLYNKSPYNINFRATPKAKNIYVGGKSGFGKTYLVQNWMLDAFAIGYNICNVDIKGNEFSGFTMKNGGTIISMRQEAKGFINTLVMRPSAIHKNQDEIVYFNQQLLYTKNLIKFACRFEDNDQISRMESLIDRFLESLYKSKGILRKNTNTWTRSNDLHPLKLYDAFKQYCSKDILEKFDIAEKMLDRMKSYFHPSGGNAHMFMIEYDMEQVLNTRILTFDFGLLNSSTIVDEGMLDMKTMFTRILKNEYTRRNNEKGIWTFQTLEESQITTDYLLNMYAEEFSLRRSQRQVTIMLGNSITSLKERMQAQTIIDNINILVLGTMGKSSREYAINEFDLEEHRETLEKIASNIGDYEHRFLLVNQMQKHATTALIKAFVPRSVANSKMFATMDIDEED